GRNGATTSFVRRQAVLAYEPLRLHVDVERELLVHPRLGGAAREEEMQPRARGRKPTHGMRPSENDVTAGFGAKHQVLRRTASSPVVNRFQLSSSWPSARRPAAVKR